MPSGVGGDDGSGVIVLDSNSKDAVSSPMALAAKKCSKSSFDGDIGQTELTEFDESGVIFVCSSACL